MKFHWLFRTPSHAAVSIGLLFLRVGASGLMIGHGWGKLSSFGERASGFPDPLGLGPELSMGLVIFAEFFCSLAVIVGLLTRLAAVPLIIAMGVAAFVHHSADPVGEKELALVYLIVYLALLLTGPGAFSVDRLLGKSRRS